VASGVTILFEDVELCPQNWKGTQGVSDWTPPHAEETNPKSSPAPHHLRWHIVFAISSIDLSNRAVIEITFSQIIL
jgi:hypothetical protein